jgi:hypothetical protein
MQAFVSASLPDRKKPMRPTRMHTFMICGEERSGRDEVERKGGRDEVEKKGGLDEVERKGGAEA